MEKDLRKKAEKNYKAKRGFYVVASTFTAVSIILFVISTQIHSHRAKFWILFPIMVLALVLGIIYVATFGFSLKAFSNVVDYEEEQIEKEIRRLSNQRKNELPPGEELSDDDRLELKELERLQKKWYDYDEFV
ncbi:MAG: 2TM domain-containing protein [Bacteroidota bacterium]